MPTPMPTLSLAQKRTKTPPTTMGLAQKRTKMPLPKTFCSVARNSSVNLWLSALVSDPCCESNHYHRVDITPLVEPSSALKSADLMMSDPDGVMSCRGLNVEGCSIACFGLVARTRPRPVAVRTGSMHIRAALRSLEWCLHGVLIIEMMTGREPGGRHLHSLREQRRPNHTGLLAIRQSSGRSQLISMKVGSSAYLHCIRLGADSR